MSAHTQTPAASEQVPAGTKKNELVEFMGNSYNKKDLAESFEHILELAIFRSESLSENDVNLVFPIWEMYKKLRA